MSEACPFFGPVDLPHQESKLFDQRSRAGRRFQYIIIGCLGSGCSVTSGFTANTPPSPTSSGTTILTWPPWQTTVIASRAAPEP